MRPESGDPNDCPEASPLMRSTVRAYSHQGHGPRADQQAGYISATSDSTTSLAKGSRSIHLGHEEPFPPPGLNGRYQFRKRSVAVGDCLPRLLVQALSLGDQSKAIVPVLQELT